LIDVFIPGWHGRLELSSGARLYRHLTDSFGLKSYLNNIKVSKFRVSLTRLRCSAYRLHVEMRRWNKLLPIAFDDRKCVLCDVWIPIHFSMPSICRCRENINTPILWFRAKQVQVDSIVKLRISSSCNEAYNMYIQRTVLTWFCISSNIISSPIFSILCVSVNISVFSSILLAVLRVASPTRLICIYGWLTGSIFSEICNNMSSCI
jgi:hypothetical protein